MFNLYIKLYKTANETLKDNSPTNNNLQIVLNPKMQLVTEEGADRRCKNLLTCNKFAVIIIDEYGDPCK